ncbi:MAG: replication factor A, partial [Candidatus Methanoperedens sp.]|nr:replication factor A [Candidatus Methanoperedens sp.]
MVNFEEIEETFKKLQGKLTPDEFRSRVETKFTEMNGLCDPRTAAMLVASELGLNENVKIKDLNADKGNVVF